MDWKTIRQNKLAKADWDGRGRSGWRLFVRHKIDSLLRAWTLSSWAKGAVAGLGIVAIAGALFGFALVNSGGGDERQIPLVRREPSPTTQPTAVSATATAEIDEPTVAATASKTATPKPPAIRTDCGEIRGTAYESAAERDWYVENCLDQVQVTGPLPTQAPPVQTPGQPPVSTSPPPPASDPDPTPTAVPSSQLTSQQAISLAVDWIVGGGGSVTSGCSASMTGAAQWTVFCADGVTPVVVCIIETPLTLWFC